MPVKQESTPNLPFDVEVEQIILGALMLDNTWIETAIDELGTEDFYDPLHQRLFDAIVRIFKTGRPSTPLTVGAEFEAASDEGFREVGGRKYLVSIARATPAVPNMADFFRIIRDLAMRRELIRLGDGLAIEAARDPMKERTALDVVAELEQHVTDMLERRRAPDEPVFLYDAAVQVVDNLAKPPEERKPLLQFGVSELDQALGGMDDGDLTILGGRPGMGKTAVALAIADAVSSGYYGQTELMGVYMASLEMKADQLAERQLSRAAYRRGYKVPYTRIHMSRIGGEELDWLADEAAALGSQPLLIDQRRGQSLPELAMRMRRAQRQLKRRGTPLRLAIIDHLQRMFPESRYRGNKVAETTEVARGLKNLAGQMDIPILCLSQLSRNVEQREDKRPMLSDLRESGAIEEEADAVALLFRPEYYVRKAKPDLGRGMEAMAKWDREMELAKGRLEIIGAKARHGAEEDVMTNCDMAYNWIGEYQPGIAGL